MSNRSKRLSLLITTVNSLDKAKEMARKIIEKKLAACISISNISSLYFWEGKLVEDDEYMLIIKTDASKISRLEDWISNNHPYEVPEILVIDAKANEKYMRWVEGVI